MKLERIVPGLEERLFVRIIISLSFSNYGGSQGGAIRVVLEQEDPLIVILWEIEELLGVNLLL